jgi:hypothetical protein
MKSLFGENEATLVKHLTSQLVQVQHILNEETDAVEL